MDLYGQCTSTSLLKMKLMGRWGQPFLEHTFLYHLTRLDHRHNFSPYFYPIYHSLFPSASTYIDTYPLLAQIIRHPLTSFLPQTSLVALAGFKLPKAIGIEGTMFFQTVIFVVFNKVVTSQVCPSYLNEMELMNSISYGSYPFCHTSSHTSTCPERKLACWSHFG
jgi:phosphatidylinositol glycan class M